MINENIYANTISWWRNHILQNENTYSEKQDNETRRNKKKRADFNKNFSSFA